MSDGRSGRVRFVFPKEAFKHKHNIRFFKPSGLIAAAPSLNSTDRNRNSYTEQSIEQRAKALLYDLQKAKNARLKSTLNSGTAKANTTLPINQENQFHCQTKNENTSTLAVPLFTHQPSLLANMNCPQDRDFHEAMRYASHHYMIAEEEHAHTFIRPEQSKTKVIKTTERSNVVSDAPTLSALVGQRRHSLAVPTEEDVGRKGSIIAKRSGRDAVFGIHPSKVPEDNANNGAHAMFLEPPRRHQSVHSMKHFNGGSLGTVIQRPEHHLTENPRYRFLLPKLTSLEQSGKTELMGSSARMQGGNRERRIEYFLNGVKKEPEVIRCYNDRDNMDRYAASRALSEAAQNSPTTVEQLERESIHMTKPPMLLKNKVSNDGSYARSEAEYREMCRRRSIENLHANVGSQPGRKSFAHNPYEPSSFRRPESSRSQEPYDHHRTDNIPHLIPCSSNANSHLEPTEHHREEVGRKRLYSPVIKYAPDQREMKDFPAATTQEVAESERPWKANCGIVVTYGYSRPQKRLKPGRSQSCREGVFVQVYNSGNATEERHPIRCAELNDVYQRIMLAEEMAINERNNSRYPAPPDVKKPEWPERFVEPASRTPSKSPIRPIAASSNERATLQPSKIKHRQSVEAVSISSHDTEVEKDETDSAFSQSDFGADDDYDERLTPTEMSAPCPLVVSNKVAYHLADRRHKGPRLYRFLLELLEQPEKYSCIEWMNKEERIFKFLNSKRVAELWGIRKNKANMKFENFARSLRCYKTRGILKKPRQKLVYQFAEVRACLRDIDFR